MTTVALDTGVPALVMKIGHYPLHHGGLGAIRSLGRAGVAVYGVHEDRRTPAACSRWLTGRFVWPTTGADPGALLDGLEAIAAQLGRQAVLVPTDDESAIFIAEHAHELRGSFLFPDQPPGLPRALASKQGLYQTCRRLGVPSPEAVVPASRAEAVAFCERASFPVVVKAIEAWVLARATAVRSTSIVPGPEALLDLYDQAGGGVLLQEHIPDGEDWIVHGYCDADSELVAGWTGVKVRSYPPHAGPTTFGRCAANPRLAAQAQALFRRLGYRGVMDMDWRLDRRDGRYKLLDFNPRVGAQFRLFSDARGLDVVRAMHLDLTGRPVPGGGPADGRTFMVEHLDTLAALGYRRDGLRLDRWLRAVAAVDEGAFLAGDDPLPAAVLGVRFALRGLARAAGRAERAPNPRPPRYLPGRRGGGSARPTRPPATAKR
jgi:D-aspartate ligase